MDVTIIICTYNRCERLQRLLDSIAKLDVPAEITWETLIIDNKSTDQTKAAVEKFINEGHHEVRYIFESRQGKSFALNTGVREARGSILVFTDDDAWVDPSWLSRIKDTFDQFDCVGVGGKIIPIWNCKKPAWLAKMEASYGLMGGVVVKFDLGEELCACSIKMPPYGANMAYKKQAFEKWGLFRTDLGPNDSKSNFRIGGGNEDTEFGRRLLRSGEKVLYVPSAIVYHPVAKERLKKKYFQRWYFSYGRNFWRLDPARIIGKSYFGVPASLLRSFFKTLISWIFAWNAQKRFHHKLDLWLLSGEIVEAWNISKEKSILKQKECRRGSRLSP